MVTKWNISSHVWAKWMQMNLYFRGGFFLVLIFVLTSCGGIPGAGQGVEFVSESGPTTLDGFISKPKGRGPFPALVLFYGCGGLNELVFDWAGKLNREGYVTLIVDSFSA